MRRSFAQSTATSTRSSRSSGSSPRCSSVSGRNRYSPGSGASPERYMTASLASARSARVVASSDPSASPSGFSCVTTTKRSFARIASATASRSLRVVVAWFIVGRGKVARDLVDERRHPYRAFDGLIVGERQRGRSLQAELAGDACLHDSVRGLEAAEGRLPLVLVAEHGDEDGPLAEIGRYADARHRHHADARILQLPDGLGDDGADRFVDAAHAVAHDREVNRPATRASGPPARAPIP